MDNGQRQTLHLSSSIKNNVVQFLLKHSHDGVLARGAVMEAADTFSISRKTVYRLWKATKEQMQRGEPAIMEGKIRGYHHVDRLDLDEEKVRNLSTFERSSLRKMTVKLNVSKSTLDHWVKQGKLRPHTNAIKHALTNMNKVARARWSRSQLQPQITQGRVQYQSMHNVVHIDEKWFYMTKVSDIYYLLPDEDEPYRSCKSKRYITKVMFMCAVSRPQFGMDGQATYDGKVGIFPFTEVLLAQRKSKNRARGTMETKSINSVTKAVMRDCLINKIIPAIKAKWPVWASKDIYIQQDNATPHISAMDADFQVVANSDGFKIQLICQPPNSPDTNILDLGFFRAIQSLQHEKPCNTVDELVGNVCSLFAELSPQTLNRVFLRLQACLTEILQCRGGNGYKVPHINTDRLQRTVGIPNVLEVEENVVRDVLHYLQMPENNGGSIYDIGPQSNAFGF
ncbi:uncharacterized protein LOC121745765 [Salvia splendens]|uniref:uncharacterized protein LOC121745765 n=1 Tax=Salvia splendens TaxID=180675 RepID=UPI001C27ABF3|nr:uncharacterized protein LOC121745765 [Salvia splendens]